MARTSATIRSSERARALAQRRHSLDAYIKSIVDRAPELTPEQCDKLTAVLRPSPDPPRRPPSPGSARRPRTSGETGVPSGTGGNRIAEADQQGGGGDVAA